MTCRLTSLFKNIPAELREFDQFVLFKLEERTGKDGKQVKTKVPHSAWTGKNASTKDPETWSSYERAVSAVKKFYMDGIGFVFSEKDPFVGIDLDNAIRNDGTIGPEQQKILEELNSYTEISHSKTGLHVIVKGKTPDGLALKKGDAFGPGQGLEIYEAGRYFVMTGDRLDGFPETINEDTGTLDALFRQFKPEVSNDGSAVFSPEALRLRDEEILAKVKQAKNGAKFEKLWIGEWSDYPSQSEADLALCRIFSYWTDDQRQIDRLFRRSGLYREKWEEIHGRETYGAMTISKACMPMNRADNHGEPGSKDYPWTDIGNAERLVAAHGDELIYCAQLGGWLVYDGVRWIKDHTDQAIGLAQTTVRKIKEEIANITDPEKISQLGKFATKSEHASRVKALLEMAKPMLAVRQDQFDADPLVINCLNGTFDLRSREFRPHSPKDMLTKVTGAEYNPGAKAPIFLSALDQYFDGNEGMIAFLQKAFGYSLTGDTREQCFFVPFGDGANGKTTLIETVAFASGEYAQAASSATFSAQRKSSPIGDDLAALKGARLVSASELTSGDWWDESRLKLLTGQDSVSCRKLYGEPFTFTPKCKFWISTNRLPNFDGSNDALTRRMRVIPFDITIPAQKQDKELLDKLKGEAAGVLHWMIEGALRWLEEGLESPKEVREATEKYRREQDSLEQFLEEECVLQDAGRIKTKDLKEAYERWCTENGFKALPKREISGYLEKRGITTKKTNGVYMCIGVTVKQSDTGTHRDVFSQRTAS